MQYTHVSVCIHPPSQHTSNFEKALSLEILISTLDENMLK